MVIVNDLEWPMLSYYVIYYEKLKKCHAANREGSFKIQIFSLVLLQKLVTDVCDTFLITELWFQ